ncbi:toxic anion resistance protein [Sporofaciens sp. SGI.106]|uniref:toxic anion resistance protein n=1 Tax=Sporofaciens sp. SGI.106 TaxID=3420568 RepID=UPI003D079674
MKKNTVNECIDNLISLLQGSLVIGNHELLSFYGSTEQQKLSEISKEISCSFFKQGYDIEITINNILDELKKFDISKQEKRCRLHKSKKAIPKSVLLEYYNSTIMYTDKLSVELKLQEAHMLKEINLLECMEMRLEQCGLELKKALDNGKEILDKYKKDDVIKENLDFLSEDITQWYSRLEQKINDLNLSCIISMQTLSQVKMLRDNDKRMVERIMVIVSRTIPIWKSQMNSFINVINGYNQDQVNQELVEELKILSSMEVIDTDIRKELKYISS